MILGQGITYSLFNMILLENIDYDKLENSKINIWNQWKENHENQVSSIKNKKK